MDLHTDTDSAPTHRKRERPDQLPDLLRTQGELGQREIERLLQQQRERALALGGAGERLAERDRQQDALGSLTHVLHSPNVPLPDYRGDPELVIAAAPFSEEAEVFRELRTQLLAQASQNGGRTALAVVSPARGEGKTHVAANLAASLAQLGGSTLLVDADLRAPRLHLLLRTDPVAAGLAELLAGKSPAQAVVRPVPDVPGLSFLPAGAVPPNPVELLQSARMSLLLYDMLRRFDHVVVDTPADAWGADARLVAAKAGAALVIGRQDHSRLPALQGLLARLRHGPAAIAGVVVNRH